MQTRLFAAIVIAGATMAVASCGARTSLRVDGDGATDGGGGDGDSSPDAKEVDVRGFEIVDAGEAWHDAWPSITAPR